MPLVRALPTGSILFTLGAGALQVGPSSMEFGGPVRSGSGWFGSCLHYKVIRTSSSCADPDIPFCQTAMDIIGSLPFRVQEYLATMPPAAIPLRSIDAVSVAEEVMAHVGVPEDILTDQGSNFMSQPLREVYSSLKTQPI